MSNCPNTFLMFSFVVSMPISYNTKRTPYVLLLENVIKCLISYPYAMRNYAKQFLLKYKFYKR